MDTDFTACQILKYIEEFEQELEASKTKNAAQILAGNLKYSVIGVKMQRTKFCLIGEIYRTSPTIPGVGVSPFFSDYLKPNKEVRKYLAENYAGGGVEKLKDILLTPARLEKLKLLV